jgi:hypothetical protein
MTKNFKKLIYIRRRRLTAFCLAAITLVVSMGLAQSNSALALNPGQPGDGMPVNQNPQAAAVIYLPITIHTWPPIPTVPVIDPIDNADQDNVFVVSWKNPGVGGTYILEESMEPAFSSSNVVYQGPALSWQVPAGGKLPGVYYFRVKTKNNYGESDWSEVQSIRVYPLFVGLQVRYDGMGYYRGSESDNIGWHETISLDALTDVDTIQAQFHDWYDPNPFDIEDSTVTSFYSVTTGQWLASNVPEDPSWKWGYSWKRAYDSTFKNGDTVTIDGQKFTVTGPHAGYTTYGKAINYWEFVNQNKFLYWDGGGDWKQYVHPGEATLRYDAGASGLLIYDNVKRHYYYQGDDFGDTIQYISNLTAANSLPGSPPVEFGLSLNSPFSDTHKALDMKSIYENGLPRW